MCGICGFVIPGRNERAEELLTLMRGSLKHRGPDDEGSYLYFGNDVQVGLGHRRLSIIDLSPTGRQPMKNEDGSLHLVVNGEIYNFRELRKNLEEKGHRFYSRSDSEVILHLYEEMGTQCVSCLRGMFAFALWDERNEILFCARDPVGIKPFLYYWNAHRFLFASELHTLLLDSEVRRLIDFQALHIYLTLNYIPAPYTIIENCRKLSPGHYLILHRGQFEEKRYWHPEEKGQDQKLTEPEIKENLRKCLSHAVEEQMIADVPLGGFLSGGIDSSIVCALMASLSSRPIKTFTIGYSDMPLFDETKYARALAHKYKTEHHEIILTSKDMLEVVPTVLDYLDEPFGDSSVIPTFVVSHETRKEVKVALSGDGGDELFAGYRMYLGERWYRRYRHLPTFIRLTLLKPIFDKLPASRDNLTGDLIRRLQKFLRGQGETLWARFMSWNEIFPTHLREELLMKNKTTLLNPAASLFQPLLEPEKEDYLNQLLLADFLISLPGDMLWKVDKMSMANSLEIRVPILDHEFCAYAFSLPSAVKLKGNRRKYIFIEAFADLLPREILTKPKWGFEVPISKWLKTSMKYLLDEYLRREKINRQGIFDGSVIEKLVQDFLYRNAEAGWHLWNLIVFQAWYERAFGK